MIDSYSGLESIENSFFKDLLPVITKVIKNIWKTGKTPLVDEELFEKTKDNFLTSIQEGYKLNGIVADTETIEALQKNLVTFSLFKNHQNMRDIASLLTTGDKIMSYEDFETEALKVSVDYNKTWLKTEYNTAISSAKSASQWVDIQNTKGTYTLLKYVTRHDERVRHEHETFDGVTLPVDHPYWNTHFPPNGFNCRCHVIKLKPVDDNNNPISVTKMKREESYHSEFNFNPGKTKQIFGDNHTYFKNLGQETVEKLKEYSETVSLKRNRWW